MGPLHIEDDDKETVVEVLTSSMLELFDKYIDFFEGILQPDSSLASMRESSIVTDNQRKSIDVLFRRLMFHKRKELLVKLHPTTETQTTFLRETLTFWKSVKDEVEGHVKMIIEAWNINDIDEPITQGYFG